MAGERRWRPLYRDWIRPDKGFMAADSDRCVLTINSALDKAIDGIDKIASS
jgi:hypothetical protein